MADIRIQDAQQATTVNPTDRIPVSNGSGLPASITVGQIAAMTPVVVGPQGVKGHRSSRVAWSRRGYRC